MKIKTSLALLIFSFLFPLISVNAGNHYLVSQSIMKSVEGNEISQKDEPKSDRQFTKLKTDSPLQRRRANFRRNTGLAGIKDLLEISQPTNIDAVRKIYVDIESSPNQSEDDRKKLFVTTVIDEFMEAVDLSEFDLNPEEATNLDIGNTGIEIKLKGEGSLKLIIKSNLESKDKLPIANIRFNKFRVPKYDKVNRIEFIMRE